MLKYETLNTERYLTESLETEQKQLRREYNQKAIRDFSTFLFGLVAIAVGYFAAQSLPTWLPTVEKFLHAQSWIDWR